MKNNNFLELVDSLEGEIFTFFQDLVNIDSDSYNLKGLAQAADLILNQFDPEKFIIERRDYDKAGPILSVTRRGAREGKIILLGHIDTVFPAGTARENPFRLEDGKVYGPGVVDMKGGVVQMVYTLKLLEKLNYQGPSIQMLLVSDEEIAHINSDAIEVFKEQAQGAKAVLCCETGRIQDALVLGRKATGTIIIEAFGRAAHAGNQLDQGRNAILALSKALLDISSLDILDGETSINPGIIEGGSATNTVADYAKALIDLRYRELDKARDLEQAIEKILSSLSQDGINFKMDFKTQYPAMNPGPKSLELLEKISGLNQQLFGSQLGYLMVGGGSDASFFSSLGLPAICGLGIRGDLSHTQDEYGLAKSLLERIKLLLALILDF